MGSIDFYCSVDIETVSEAFQSAVDDAFYWHGHSGYSGTICEKPGYIVLDFGKKLSLAEAEEVGQELNMSWKVSSPRLIELIGSEERATKFANIFNDKWNDAIAIELIGNSWYFCGLASE